MQTDRLQKIIARAGLASRRAAEELITSGRVRVNGRVVTELGAKAHPLDDKIEVDGQRLVAETLVYVVLHKPRGVVSTLRDPEGRPTVAELVKEVAARLYPVGRLDFATSGVLLLTNDGDFANGLLHPRGGVPKTYVLKVQGLMEDADLEPWRNGVRLPPLPAREFEEAREDDTRPTAPAEARILRHEGDKTWLEVTIREGRNQQIRRMGEATGWRVMRLARTSFAGIDSEGLRPGAFRHLTPDELMAMKKQFGVPKRMPRGERPVHDVRRRSATRGAPPPAPARAEGRGARGARPEAREGRGPRRRAR